MKRNKTTHDNIVKKLDPSRFTAMSGKMAAIVGCVFGVQYTKPQIVELTTTTDSFFLGRTEGDIGFNDFLGSIHDLKSNYTRLLEAAGLSAKEKAYAYQQLNLALGNSIS